MFFIKTVKNIFNTIQKQKQDEIFVQNQLAKLYECGNRIDDIIHDFEMNGFSLSIILKNFKLSPISGFMFSYYFNVDDKLCVKITTSLADNYAKKHKFDNNRGFVNFAEFFIDKIPIDKYNIKLTQKFTDITINFLQNYFNELSKNKDNVAQKYLDSYFQNTK